MYMCVSVCACMCVHVVHTYVCTCVMCVHVCTCVYMCAHVCACAKELTSNVGMCADIEIVAS